MSDDISQAPPPHAVAWRKEGWQRGGGSGRGTGGHDGRDFARAADAYARSSEEGRDVADSIWVQGIPQADLTPPVRRAIGALMAEVEHLRQQLDTRSAGPMPTPHDLDQAVMPVTDHTAGGKDTADAGTNPAVPSTDPVGLLPADDLETVLRTHLSLFMDGGPAPALASLSLANTDDLAIHHGDAAARMAAATMAEAVVKARKPDEIVGQTPTGAVAVVLSFDGRVDHLWQRARALARAAETTASWHGRDLRIHVRLGVHLCARGETPAEALEHAEATARRVV